MEGANARWMLAAAAAACAVVAFALGHQGAWAMTACWGCASAGMFLMAKASMVDEQSRRQDEHAEELFARGQPSTGSGRSGLVRNAGILMLGSTCFFISMLVALVGCFAAGLGYGIIASLPLVLLAKAAVESVGWEEDAGLGQGDRHAKR